MVLNGFQQLSEEFFADLLSRRRKRSVRVRGLTVTDRAPRPGDAPRAAELKLVELDTSIGPLRLMVKQLDQRRKREALVWRFLARAGGMPLPEVYHIEFDEKAGRFGVIAELVAPETETEAWDESRCRAVGSAVARLHAPFWGRAGELPETFPTPQTPPEATVEPAVRRFLDGMIAERQAVLYAAVPEVFAFLAKLLRMPPGFFAEPTDPPTTLIHGSLGRGEVLFSPQADRPECVLIGWEHARVGRGSEDLAALINSLSPAERAAGREGLLAAYLEHLALAGVAADRPRLSDEIDRQRVLLAGRNLPQVCGLYVERAGSAEHRQWCASFEQTAGPDASELKGLLGRFHYPEPPIPEER